MLTDCDSSLPVRALWGKVLGHVKTFSSREIPDVDLASFTQSCKDVVGTEADASSCHDEKRMMDAIRKVLSVLPAFGDEDGYLAENPTKVAEVTEHISLLAKWLENCNPDFGQMGAALSEGLSELTLPEKEEGASYSLRELAANFPPTFLKLPDFFTDFFQLQGYLSEQVGVQFSRS